jgi:hypothetical protein
MNEKNKISEEMIINKVIINDDSDNESIEDKENVEYTSDYDIEYDNHSDYDADEKELELYNEMMDYTDNKGCNINDDSDNESIQDEDVNVEYTIDDDIEYDDHSDDDANEREIALYNEIMDYTHDEGCVINDKISDIDDDECQYCDWNSNLPQSHVIHCIYCPIIVSIYDTYIDDDGEIFYTLKTINK